MDSQLALFLEATRPRLDLDALCGDEERAVARALRWGREGARKVEEIARAAGLSGRKAQAVIEHLIHAHRWPIGTSMSEPFGNYLIDSPEDLEQTVALLRTRGISNLQRAAALKRMSLEAYLRLVQTEINMEEECAPI